jgi:hypothetical protein
MQFTELCASTPFLHSIRSINLIEPRDEDYPGLWGKKLTVDVNRKLGFIQSQCYCCIQCGNFKDNIYMERASDNTPSFTLSPDTVPNAWCFCADNMFADEGCLTFSKFPQGPQGDEVCHFGREDQWCTEDKDCGYHDIQCAWMTAGDSNGQENYDDVYQDDYDGHSGGYRLSHQEYKQLLIDTRKQQKEKNE